MSERQLASIQRIIAIDPIEGADAIEVATVNSWKVVVKKGEFSVGDLVIYLEIDSWVPTELAPFLTKAVEPREYNGVKGERLRTVRLRGQISQGLILPGDLLFKFVNHRTVFNEGDNVTEILKVQKWEAPVSPQLAGTVKGNFPSMIPKTDEERIQNLTKAWPKLSQFQYEVTEKLEGSSMTVAMVNGEFIVCSRNLNLKETEGNTFWQVARKYDIEQKLRDAGYNNIAIQGELVGEGVEGNHYGLKGHHFYVYSIYDIVKGEYVDPVLRHAHCKNLELTHVPVIASVGFVSEGGTTMSIAEVLKFADGKSTLNPEKLREGLVFKRIDGQEHFKAISNEYLIKFGR